jgi:hypothetical protein
MITSNAADGRANLVFAEGTVPEPSSVVLAATGFVGLLAWGWRRRKRSH